MAKHRNAGKTERTEAPAKIACKGETRGGAKVEVAATWVGRVFASQETGRPYGPRVWDIEVRVGRRTRTSPFTGTRREMERTVRSLARRLCAKEA